MSEVNNTVTPAATTPCACAATQPKPVAASTTQPQAASHAPAAPKASKRNRKQRPVA